MIDLRLLRRGRVGDAIGAREEPEEIVEAVVLGVEHDDRVDAIERAFAGREAAASGDDQSERREAEPAERRHRQRRVIRDDVSKRLPPPFEISS